MSVVNLEEIGRNLRQSACFETSFDELGLTFDDALALEVIASSTLSLTRPPVEDGLRREARVESPLCKKVARSFMQPVVECLFPIDKYPKAAKDWSLFGVNYYETGAVFPIHRDLINPDLATIVIVSLCGVRWLRVKGHDKPLRQIKGSVTLLDGGANPEHTASCLDGPSVSIVADVPSLMY